MPLGSTVVSRIRSLLQEKGVVSLGRLEGAALHIERIVDEEYAKLNASKERTRAKRAGFTPPTPEEVTAYSREIDFPLDGDGWCSHYEAKAWKISGATRMADWKAAVRKWKSMGWVLTGVANAREKKNAYEVSIMEVPGWRELLSERSAEGLISDVPSAWEALSPEIRGRVAAQRKYALQLAQFAKDDPKGWEERLDRKRVERGRVG